MQNKQSERLQAAWSETHVLIHFGDVLFGDGLCLFRKKNLRLGNRSNVDIRLYGPELLFLVGLRDL